MTLPLTQLQNRISGALIGMAAGDALGQPCKGRSWRQVAEDVGSVGGYLEWKDAGEHSPRHPAGSSGDLVSLALGVAARAGAERRKLRASELIDELRNRPGLQSLPAQAALARINAGMEPSRSAVPELAGPEGLYLAVPVASLHIGDPEGAFLAARSVIGPILLGGSLEAGQVLAAAIAVALGPLSSPGLCLDAALDLAPVSVGRVLNPLQLFAREHLGHPVQYLLPALGAQLSAVATSDAHGPALEALAVALGMLYVSDGNAEQSVTGAVSYGSWSHAAGAAAGALAGSLQGATALPEAWSLGLQSPAASDILPVASSLASVNIAEAQRQQQRAQHIRQLHEQTISQ